MTLGDNLRNLALQADQLETDKQAMLDEVARLTQALADCQNPEPTPGVWVPPMKPVQVVYQWPIPDITLNPGANIRSAFQGGARAIKLNPGDYGNQTLGSMPNTHVWCDTYRGAKFANGTGAFVLPAAGMVIGGLQVEGYGTHANNQGGAKLACDGVNGQKFINLAVGKAKNNAYSIKGNFCELRGGEIYQAARFGWAGGGADNLVEDLYYDTVGTLADSGDSDSGLCKIVKSERQTVRRICGLNTRWNGIWFDIQNQPGLVEDIYADGVGRAPLFIEVSYGGENQTGVWKTWRIRRIGGKNPHNIVRDSETNLPIPAVVQISATPDIDIEDVYGDGWRVGVSLLNPASHKQITGEIGDTDRTRLGLQNITVKNQNTQQTTIVAALSGSAHTVFPNMRQPTRIKWVDPDWKPTDRFRDFPGMVTETQFRQKYT